VPRRVKNTLRFSTGKPLAAVTWRDERLGYSAMLGRSPQKAPGNFAIFTAIRRASSQ
jgi:hypothetical protein